MTSRISTRASLEEVASGDDEFADTLVAGFGMPGFIRDPMQEMMTIFEDEEQISLVARVEGRPVGVGTGLLSADTLGTYNITTLAEARGRGVGTAVTGSLLHLAANGDPTRYCTARRWEGLFTSASGSTMCATRSSGIGHRRRSHRLKRGVVAR